MTKDEIQAEWDAFISYPEGSGNLYVTTTSALIFARTIAEMVSQRHAQAAQPAHHLPEAGNMVAQPARAQPAQADLQAAFAKGMACRPASAQMPAEPGEKAQPMCTPEEAARICSTLGPVPDGKTWAQHMVDTARTGWVPSTMGHAEYLVEPWPILGWS